MKKFVAIVLALVMTMAMAACGSQQTSAPAASTPAPSTSAPAAAETPAAPEVKAVTWKFATNTLESTETAKVYQEMADAMNKATNGEVTVEIFYGGALGAEADVIQNVQTGNIQMGHTSFALLAQLNEAWNVMDLPFMFDSTDHFAKYIATDECQALMATFQDQGIWFNYAGIQGYRYTNMAKKVLKTVDDFKGQTIRVMDNAVQMNTLKALGAIPITVPYSDVYNALNTGVCDGWTAIYTGMNETSSTEVAPYVTEVPMFACVTGIYISTKALDALSPEGAEAVKTVYGEYMPKVLASMYAEDAAYRTVFENAGTLKEVYTVEDTKPFIDAVSSVWGEIAAQYNGVQEQIDVINSVR